MNHPHKSTTHKEKFFHLGPVHTGHTSYSGCTVFMREEKDGAGWLCSVALCSWQDQFCKRVGRSQARRRYFQGKRSALMTLPPTLLTAQMFVVYTTAKREGVPLDIISLILQDMRTEL